MQTHVLNRAGIWTGNDNEQEDYGTARNTTATLLCAAIAARVRASTSQFVSTRIGFNTWSANFYLASPLQTFVVGWAHGWSVEGQLAAMQAENGKLTSLSKFWPMRLLSADEHHRVN